MGLSLMAQNLGIAIEISRKARLGRLVDPICHDEGFREPCAAMVAGNWC